MRTTTPKPQDYKPRPIPQLSSGVLSTLQDIRSMDDLQKKSKAWQAWRSNNFKDYAMVNEAFSDNYSNFCFLLERRNPKNAQVVDAILNEFCRYKGFKRRLNNEQKVVFSCNPIEVFDIYNILEGL